MQIDKARFYLSWSPAVRIIRLAAVSLMRDGEIPVTEIVEPDMDFQKFSPRFDDVMAELVAQVPADIQPWAR
jgi:hypothetical protein